MDLLAEASALLGGPAKGQPPRQLRSHRWRECPEDDLYDF